ncbi:SICA antigen [Plasmodium coatneyi]|uniref:SICA antigen n=1 Tax=Plasmodium coatneyi TaxID=208452 RepID=A0A1B1E7I0_9APIC|nr:SICA antigen [Plasmodium coatneyi]ANQ10927.1 SICA antigen [Plasmodium coatneyi]
MWKWMNAFITKMNEDNSSGLAQELCQTMKEQGQTGKEDEEKVCEFILKNLLKVEGIGAGQCEKGKNVDEEMKRYVECAVMKIWSTLYLRDHCDKGNVVWNAFGEMKRLNENFDAEGKCKKCDYSEVLEQMMVIKEIPMLAIILHMIQKNTEVMKLINSGKSKQACKEQGVNGWVVDFLNNNGTMITETSGSTGKEAVDDGARSADSGKSSGTGKDSQGGARDIILTLGGGKGLRISYAPSKGPSEDAVVLHFNGVGPPATVQHVPASSSSPSKNDCKQNELCPRVKCVTEKWFPHRHRNPNDQNDWDTLWNNDVKEKLLKDLSEAMIKNGATDNDVCISMQGANKQACNYIIKGLKHIYGIEKGKDSSKPQKVLDDQIFHRTMSCLLLNAYADKLKEEAQKKIPKCDVKDGIDHAFRESAEIKKTACIDGTCHLCQQEDFKNCTIGNNENVWNKVNEMLKEKSDKIQETLANICPKPSPPSKPNTSTSISTKDCKDGNKNCLDEKVGQMFQRRWNANNDQVYGLFQEFNRELSEDDEKGGFTSVCDDIVGGQGVNMNNLPRCFCKILIRNLVKVTNNDSTYTINGKEKKVSDMKPGAACDLLNLWLFLYGSIYNVSEEDVKYAFKAITNLNEEFDRNKYENCVYTGKFSVNQTEEGVGFKDITTWFMNHDIKNKMWKINKGTACEGKDGKGSRHSAIEGKVIKEISNDLKTKAEAVAKQIKEGIPIVKEIERKIKEECAKSGIGEDEKEEWEEAVIQFNNIPNNTDDKDEFEKIKNLSAWCDMEISENGVSMEKYKDFCKTLVKNILFVRKNKYDCEAKRGQIGSKPCVKMCDLLNIWLLGLRDSCIPMEAVKLIFQVVEAWEEEFDSEKKGTMCVYNRISNLYRCGEEMLSKIQTWMQGGQHRKHFGHSPIDRWCKGGVTSINWKQVKIKNKKVKEELSNEGKQYFEKVEEIKTTNSAVLDQIKEIMETSSPPTPPSEPARSASSSTPKTVSRMDEVPPDRSTVPSEGVSGPKGDKGDPGVVPAASGVPGAPSGRGGAGQGAT